ncbi:tripartite tricarboxylate transporter substrate binding protein [Aquabacterium sp. J223]|uniref:Bug family tripartite tricarboxylate transporter substrate binding protein n=1 Tax=Aquabacterium sp. J223 TaxID=2898431 RepID=UPI0021ADE86A|nr:tripartite tricarboxylate transporter substrate binding protein [Aquabacterium sp. J223]UUX94248.1 tripartite tricarboxylate transporter substrate binding protein [Aquabacterium sp. J223]
MPSMPSPITRGRLPRRALLALAGAALAPGRTAAQAFPNRPIRLVVPYPPGGPLDIGARALAQAMGPGLGTTVVVENRTGAGGNIGADAVAKAAPDGHTLLIGAVATHAINPWLYPRMPYDALRDFTPITLIAEVPNVLVLPGAYAREHRIADVAGFIAHLKARPGRLQFASGGNGSAGHLAGELFKQLTGTFAVHIPYRGAAPAQLALLSGEVQFMFDNLASAAPRLRDGSLKALGVTTPGPAGAFPELPALARSGVPALKGFDISTWFGLFGPAGLPAPVLQRLNEQATAALRSAAVTETLARLAAEPAPGTPQDLQRKVEADHARYREIVRRSGATVD